MLRNSLKNNWDIIQNLSATKSTLLQEESIRCSSAIDTSIRGHISPLPELIIEKEPNRHDEPPEFYQELEKKVLELHRKLFVDSIKANALQSSNFCRETTMFVDYLSPTEQYKNEGINSAYSADNDELSASSSKENSTNVEEQSFENRSDKLSDTSKLTDISQDSKIIIETQVQVHQASIISQSATLKTPSIAGGSLSPEDPEIMRGRGASYESVQSISVLDDERKSSTNCSTDMTQDIIYVIEIEEAEEESLGSNFILESSSDDQTLKRENTEKCGISTARFGNITAQREKTKGDSLFEEVMTLPPVSLTEEHLTSQSASNSTASKHSSPFPDLVVEKKPNRHTNNKRTYRSPRPSSPKKKKFHNQATQTDFSSSDDEDDENRRETMKHFFVGKPVIFDVRLRRNRN